jgi:hypothetical protein
MKKFTLLLLSNLLLSGCMPLYLLWAQLNPREAYQEYWGGQNIDPIPEAEIDRTILAREFEGVCQPRVYLDGTPVYAAIRLDGVVIEKKNFEFSELFLFKRDNLDIINNFSDGDKELNCRKITKCLNTISIEYIKIGEYPFALLYSRLKSGNEGYIRDSALSNLHRELNDRFSVEKCLADSENGEYFYYSPWFYNK